MKKKIFWILIIMLVVFYMPTVLAVDIKGCNAVLPGVKIDSKIANTVHALITIIKIVVPIILVVFGMIDLLKGITAQKEDEIKKGQSILVKRIIAGLAVFFVIAIVQLLVSFVSNDDASKKSIANCVNCFLNGAGPTGVCKK